MKSIINKVLLFVILIYAAATITASLAILFPGLFEFITSNAISEEISISACVNEAPIMTMDCDNTAVVGTEYTCQVNATDAFGGTLSFSDSTSLFNIGASTGLIEFTPVEDDIDVYVINISVSDGISGCNLMDSDILALMVVSESDIASSSGVSTGRVKTGMPFDPKLIIGPSELNASVLQGEIYNGFLIILNKEVIPLDVSISVNAVSDILSISPSSFRLNGGDSKTIKAMFKVPLSKLADNYNGKIILDTDYKTFEVPVKIEVLQREAPFNIKLNTNNNFLSIPIGGIIDFDVSITDADNVLNSDFYINYDIFNSDGYKVYSEKDLVKMTNEYGYKNAINIPSDLELGEYSLVASINYNGYSTSDKLDFEVVAVPFSLSFKSTGVIVSVVIAAVGLFYFMKKKFYNPPMSRSNKNNKKTESINFGAIKQYYE